MADDDDVDVIGDFSIHSYLPVADVCKEQSSHDPSLNSQSTHLAETWTPSHQMTVADGLDNSYNIPKHMDTFESEGTVPNFIHEEILVECGVPDSIHEAMTLMKTGLPTLSAIAVYRSDNASRNTIFNSKTNTSFKSKQSLLKPDVLRGISKSKHNDDRFVGADKEVLLYADEFVIGSTESVGGDDDSCDEERTANTTRSHLMSVTEKKAGNHRRKYTLSSSSSSSKGQPKTKFNISVLMKNKHKRVKSPPKTKNKIDNAEVAVSPKLQLVFSSGQALPVSEGEQVIKIEKKKSGDSDSDIDIDIDSDDEGEAVKPRASKTDDRISSSNKVENKTILIQRKFEPVRRRQKKVNLDGDGGCTIMHTESGDLIEVLPEPRKEKVPKKQPINLLSCKQFSADKPAPYSVRLLVSALVLMDAHAHGSRAEVMGLLGGELRAGVLQLRGYQPCAAAASHTHCDMCPVSQARAADALNAAGLAVVGWHHSHPRFAAQPSLLDLRTQRSLQRALERHRAPFLALITSQHWPRGRRASTYRCFRVESEGDECEETGYQFSVKVIPDLTAQGVPDFLQRLREVAASHADTAADYRVRMPTDLCTDAGVTHLEKCLSSVSHHLTSAGYSEQDLTFKHVMRGVRDVFR